MQIDGSHRHDSGGLSDHRPSISWFRFYAELNDFLPPEQRNRQIEFSFFVSPTIKDAVEGLGIPHVEIDLILVDGHSVGFSHRLALGERVYVYPVFKTLDIPPEIRLQDRPLRCPAFAADVHLSKLARRLRLLGLDTLYSNTFTDQELVKISTKEGRILLTRDRVLLKHGSLTRGYWIRSVHAQQQAIEVLRRYNLAHQTSPFTRCPACNGQLKPVAKSDVMDRIPPRTAAWLNDYVECATCLKLYWHGSHFERLNTSIGQILNKGSGR